MLEGTTLGPYHVLEELARGGMGVVYRAVDPRLGQEVALKVLTSQRASARFEREVGALARVQHSNVVPVLDCGIYLDHPWVAMAYVPGVTLQDRLEQRGPVTPGLAVSWIAKLSRALAAVHEAGVVHRDVKPANVILTPTGEPVLTDFGLALDSESHERLSMDGAILGSPGYFSPEQAVGDLSRIDLRSDVYGLGATLYALLCGRPPIQLKGSLVEVVVATQEQKPEPPSAWNQRVDRELDRICLTCLEKRPRDRPPTALALALELELYLREGQVKPKRRLPAWAVWTLVGAGVLGGLGYAVSVLRGEPDAGPEDELALDVEQLKGRLDALEDRYQAEDYDALLLELEPLLDDPEAPPELLRLLARCYGQLGRYDACLELTHLLLREDPSPKVYLIHGTALAGQERYREAMDALERGLELHPERKTESSLLANRAMCRMQHGGDVSASLEDWQHMLSLLLPEEINANHHYNLGVMLGLLERHEEAAQAYRRSLELDPDQVAAEFNLAVVLFFLDRLEESEQALNRVRRMDPDFPNLHFRLAWIQVRHADLHGGVAGVSAGDYVARAVEHFTAHLERDPRDGTGYAGRGICLARLGRFDEAERDLLRAIEYAPSAEQEADLRAKLEGIRRARLSGGY